MAGRKPVPAAVRRLTGTKSRRGVAEVKAPPGPLDPPKHLKGVARAEWIRVAQQLDDLGLLAGIDRANLEAYCGWYETWRQARADVARHGMTFKAVSGQRKKNPAAQIMSDASREMRKFAVEFGMTPSSRTRVAPDMKKPAGQPPLPGADTWPEARDPAKPKPPELPPDVSAPPPIADGQPAAPIPAARDGGDAFTDDDFFARIKRTGTNG